MKQIRNNKRSILAMFLALTLILSAAAMPSFAGEMNSGNTVTVTDTASLRAALADGSVSKILLGNDINVDAYNLVIQPNRLNSELVIDGNGNTLTEYFVRKYDYTKPIRLNSKGTVETITLQNMDIVGGNGYGTIYIPDSVKGVNQKYIDISYKGPKLTHNSYGTAYYKDVDIHIAFADGGSYSGQAGVVNKVVLDGRVTIKKNNDADHAAFEEVFWLRAHNSDFKILAGADVTVENQANGHIYPSGFIHGDAGYAFTVGEGASLQYEGYGQFYEGISPAAFTVGKNADVDIRIKEDPKPTIGIIRGLLVKGNLVIEEGAKMNFAVSSNSIIHTRIVEAANMMIEEGAEFKVYVDGPLKESAVKVDGALDVSEDSVFSVVSENNTAGTVLKPLVLVGQTATFDNPQYALIYNDNTNAHFKAKALSSHTGTVTITAETISYWTDPTVSGGPNPEDLVNPSSIWKNSDESIFTVTGKFHAISGAFKTLTASGYNGETVLNANTFKTTDVNIILINGSGSGPVLPEKSAPPTINDVYEDDGVVTGTGVPTAAVTVIFYDGTQETVTVDAAGNWTLDHDDLEAGDIIRAYQVEIGKLQSDEVDTVVLARPITPEKSAPPTINDVYEDDGAVTGTGVPTAAVTVIFYDGTQETVTVDAAGNWTLDHDDLEAGDIIRAYQVEIGKLQSNEVNTVVLARAAVSAPPEIRDVYTFSTIVAGWGVPNAEVTVMFPNGGEVKATVSPYGEWAVNTPGSLWDYGGQLVRAYQIEEGKTQSETVSTIIIGD